PIQMFDNFENTIKVSRERTKQKMLALIDQLHEYEEMQENMRQQRKRFLDRRAARRSVYEPPNATDAGDEPTVNIEEYQAEEERDTLASNDDIHAPGPSGLAGRKRKRVQPPTA